MSNEVENEVVEPKSRMDHLSDVLDAQLSQDDDAAEASFHNYLTMTTQNVMAGDEVDEVEVEVEVSDEEIAALAAVDDEVDDVDVSDIDITDHLPEE